MSDLRVVSIRLAPLALTGLDDADPPAARRLLAEMLCREEERFFNAFRHERITLADVQRRTGVEDIHELLSRLDEFAGLFPWTVAENLRLLAWAAREGLMLRLLWVLRASM